METKEKRHAALTIARALTKSLALLGFKKTKPSFWTRPAGPTIQFIHLHLFSYAPAYRVHLGIRVLNEDFPAVALNGLSSQDGWFKTENEYRLEFDGSNASIDRCVKNLARFCAEVAEPWFSQFADPIDLIVNARSPLNKEQKEWLRLALDGKVQKKNVQRSKKLLGLA